jgi:hypothetical protein
MAATFCEHRSALWFMMLLLRSYLSWFCRQQTCNQGPFHDGHLHSIHNGLLHPKKVLPKYPKKFKTFCVILDIFYCKKSYFVTEKSIIMQGTKIKLGHGSLDFLVDKKIPDFHSFLWHLQTIWSDSSHCDWRAAHATSDLNDLRQSVGRDHFVPKDGSSNMMFWPLMRAEEFITKIIILQLF